MLALTSNAPIKEQVVAVKGSTRKKLKSGHRLTMQSVAILAC